MTVKISAMASVLPEAVVTSQEVEERVRGHSASIRIIPGMLQSITGVETRRYAAACVDTSDLAVEACRRVLAKTGTACSEIDLLIFASASQDLMEPATAHIVQHKLGTNAAVMDVKNACNSFINGIQVAEALIQTGQYRKVLVANGEIPSRCIKWNIPDFEDLRRHFLGYTLGDAGVAALLEPSTDGSGIFYRHFTSMSKHWHISTLPGGGSMHPRGEEWSYCQGDGIALREAFRELGATNLVAALAATGLTFADFAKILVHQVSLSSLEAFLEVAQVPAAKVLVTVPYLGNMISASVPVGFDLAESRGEIRRGDKVLFIGLAAGISLGIVMFQY